MATAAELLRRLGDQPGIVLADEVGMGKTFVALAVAVSAMWADKGKRPVVIMVPTSVERKWERDLELFKERCIRRDEDRSFRWVRAQNALSFFRLLDDPVKHRARLIFLSHGAFHRNLQDPWVKLAILKFAMHHAKLGDRKRAAIFRYAAAILRTKGSYGDGQLFARLVAADFDRWRAIIAEHGEDPRDDPGARRTGPRPPPQRARRHGSARCAKGDAGARIQPDRGAPAGDPADPQHLVPGHLAHRAHRRPLSFSHFSSSTRPTTSRTLPPSSPRCS